MAVDTIAQHLSPELVGFLLTLGVSLIIGFEREEGHPDDGPEMHFGGIRTFPIIGLGGFLLTIAFPGTPLPFAAGMAVLGLLISVSYWGSVQRDDVGLTTEVSALLTFTLGATAARGMYWITIAAGVVAVILLQEKKSLEGLALRLPRRELRILLRFLLLSAVILPVVPNQPFSVFEINPFKLWLVVVAVSGVSYFSYLIRIWLGEDRGLIVAGLLGGIYSSTVTTVVLARQSRSQPNCSMGFAGAIIAATGMMYLRLWILVWFFAPAMALRLSLVFLPLGACAALVGVVVSRKGTRQVECASAEDRGGRSGNPLEMSSALGFAVIFVGVLVITRLVAERFGGTGLLVMAAIMGAADVDPFILGLTQVAGNGLALGTVALAVVVAAATNNLMKGIYALIFGNRRTGTISLVALICFGLVSVALFLVLG